VADAVMQDAQGYAEEYGISNDEAVSRLMLQDSIGELNAALTLSERDTFGGLWVEHAPQYRVVTRFTRDGENIIRPYIEKGPLADLVEVRPAKVTLAELEVELAQIAVALRELDFGVNASISVPENRVEIYVTDPAWFEGELQKANILLPAGAVLVPVEGQSAADIDICSAPPVEGVAFPRQFPVEGERVTMAAEMIGDLVLEGGCLRVDSIYGEGSSLPIWPAEYSLQSEGDYLMVLDETGKVVAREGEEVYMSGGQGSIGAVPACVQDQMPADCTGPFWVVGDQVRSNLKRDSDLFSLKAISSADRTLLFLNKKSILDEWTTDDTTIRGNLILYNSERCLRLATDSNPGGHVLIWPADFNAQIGGNGIEILDGSGMVVAQEGEVVQLRGGEIPVDWDQDSYRALLSDLPRDCHGPYWIVSETVK
jgi:hypothetical protein